MVIGIGGKLRVDFAEADRVASVGEVGCEQDGANSSPRTCNGLRCVGIAIEKGRRSCNRKLIRFETYSGP